VTSDSPESIRKAQIDAVLLKLQGVIARKINGLEFRASIEFVKGGGRPR